MSAHMFAVDASAKLVSVYDVVRHLKPGKSVNYPRTTIASIRNGNGDIDSGIVERNIDGVKHLCAPLEVVSRIVSKVPKTTQEEKEATLTAVTAQLVIEPEDQTGQPPVVQATLAEAAVMGPDISGAADAWNHVVQLANQCAAVAMNVLERRMQADEANSAAEAECIRVATDMARVKRSKEYLYGLMLARREGFETGRVLRETRGLEHADKPFPTHLLPPHFRGKNIRLEDYFDGEELQMVRRRMEELYLETYGVQSDDGYFETDEDLLNMAIAPPRKTRKTVVYKPPEPA
ncbi:hypothetical protein JKP88DRAFT_241270 [Tribonema minus]|uniref:Uncharacterized protein n=1 Tax=Tribonema minus TaxID=303371 RepID=A0A836CET1_9STRA|nr:hypothetical protein JKP88DRAFT_241270 [Tribonema minus]